MGNVFLTFPQKVFELSKYMQTALDEDWRTNRGMEIVSVAVASISYTDDSTKLINMRNEGAKLTIQVFAKAMFKVPWLVVWRLLVKMKVAL